MQRADRSWQVVLGREIQLQAVLRVVRVTLLQGMFSHNLPGITLSQVLPGTF